MFKVFTRIFMVAAMVFLTACSPDVEFTGMDGFNFGMSEKKILALCKERGFVINQKYMGYEKQFGQNKGAVFMVFDKQKKLKAFDVKFYPMVKQPEKVREMVFSIRDYLNNAYMEGNNSVKSHANFAVLHTKWEFADCYMFLGTYEQDFAACPRLIVIRDE